jgi:hypothetical protein
VIPAGATFHFGAGFALGIIIGLVSSILGVLKWVGDLKKDQSLEANCLSQQ